MMNDIGYINTEGGPLIISDSNALDNWNGIEGSDYEQLCSVFDADWALEGFAVDFKNYLPIAWELEGGGKVRIYKDYDRILLVKAWLPEKEFDLKKVELLTTSPVITKSINIGNLTVNSGFIFVFWATESLCDIQYDNKKEYGLPRGDFAINNSVLFIKTSVKKYSCIHDKINENGLFARRLHLIPRYK